MNTLALVMPGPTEWVVILMIVLVLFGAKKLPELARSLGQGMNEFRKARQEFPDRSLIGVVLNGTSDDAAPYARYYYDAYEKKGNTIKS